MVKSNSLRVHLMVLLYDSFNSGLSHAESARIHGVGVSTSRYAARWCRRIHSAAESFVSRQGLNDLHYYRTMIARDIRESLSLQEGCARHGCPPRTYRMWEYAYYSGLLDRRESELTGRQPQKKGTEMAETTRKRAARAADLEKELEAARAENEYLRCENAYLKKKDGTGGEAGAPAGSPVWAEAVRAVTALRGEYPLELLLRVSGMSRSTYYHRAGLLRRREEGRREYEKRQKRGRKSAANI